MSIAEAMLAELEQETKTTRKVLERVPEDKLTWKPHPKSMSLGELAMHIATAPAILAEMTVPDVFELKAGKAPEAASRQELLDALDASLAKTRSLVSGMDDARMAAMWSAEREGKTVVTFPRVAFLRSAMLNHGYHHRGQLTVYLRLLDVPVPAIYGPSADDNPFQ